MLIVLRWAISAPWGSSFHELWITRCTIVRYFMYRISGIFRVGLIFAEFATSLKSPNIDTAKNKPFYASSLRVIEIAKIGLGKNLTHLRSFIFAKITRLEKFPIYGTSFSTINNFHSALLQQWLWRDMCSMGKTDWDPEIGVPSQKGQWDSWNCEGNI